MHGDVGDILPETTPLSSTQMSSGGRKVRDSLRREEGWMRLWSEESHSSITRHTWGGATLRGEGWGTISGRGCFQSDLKSEACWYGGVVWCGG